MLRRSFLTASILLLAACATSVPQESYPDLTFTHHSPIQLRAGSLEIVSNWNAPLRAPNVDHEAPVTPKTAITAWSRDVLYRSGGTDKAKLVITDASIIETPLKTTGGVKGVFTVDQAFRYDLRMEARLEIRDALGRMTGQASVFATRSATLAEDASARQRSELLYRMVEGAANDFATAMDREIRKHLGFALTN